MKKSIAVVTSLLATLLTTGCSVFGVRSGYEAPPYEVVATVAPDLEVRRYGPRLAVEAEVEATDEMQGRSDAFRILADYIFGENEPEQEIAMTSPVEVETGSTEIAMTVPVETRAQGGRVRMRFFTPAEYTRETLPKPKDPRVRVVEAPGETLAVLRFSGRGKPEVVAERTDALLAAVKDSAWQPIGEPTALYYDPPWTLPFLRRNEVAVQVQARP